MIIFRSDEQEQFFKLVQRHIDEPDAPLLLEGATGLGKTLPFLVAAAASGKKVAIVFPTHQLIDQVLSSWDLKATLAEHPAVSVRAFRPKSHFEDAPKDYTAQKGEASEADIMFCTSVSVIIDQRLGGEYNGATNRDVIIFDEADQLPQFAALASDLSISRQDLKSLGIKESSPKETVAAIYKKKNAPSEITAMARLIEEAIGLGDVWFIKVGFAEDGALEVKSRLPGRLLKKVSNRPSTIFISATLSVNGTFKDFHRAMGIDTQSRLSSVIEPQNHGKLHFEFVTEEELGSDKWIEAVCEEVEDAEHPVLVATPSHSLAQRIAEKVSSATLRLADETTSEAAARMGPPQVLVAAGAWAGLDTPVQWKTVIVPRIPYTGPNNLREFWYDDEEEFGSQVPNVMSSFIDSNNAAARRLKQVFGRGLRKPDAECTIVICDPRIDRFSKIAPRRFEDNYLEGRKIASTSTRSERSWRLRKDALEHHGKVCMACGFIPEVLRQLEVHHLNPLADQGPNHTSLDDVAVLCRNCHGLAHDTNPPIPLAELRERVLKSKNKRPSLSMI